MLSTFHFIIRISGKTLMGLIVENTDQNKTIVPQKHYITKVFTAKVSKTLNSMKGIPCKFRELQLTF